MTPKSKLATKIAVWSILIHVILIALTFLEVFIYSTFINSGHDVQFYEQHAQESGPFVAIIAGFAIVYLVARSLAKNRPNSRMLVGIGLPMGYILLDILLLVLSGAAFLGSLWVFVLSYVTKLLAGYLGSKAAKG